MPPRADRNADQRLLQATLEFVAGHADPALRRFRAAVAAWGVDWVAVPPAHLPAADLLPAALANTVAETHDLTALFAAERESRKWEQSYTRADGVVGEDMLSGYGFAEVIGKRGPFLSEKVRCGIGIWGPDILYPPHRHRAEEVYLLLAGRAAFTLEDAPPEIRGPGEAVHVPSLQTHGFRSLDEPMVVFYVWQAGDLREKSSFT